VITVVVPDVDVVAGAAGNPGTMHEHDDATNEPAPIPATAAATITALTWWRLMR
jgi:hypothetical protein